MGLAAKKIPRAITTQAVVSSDVERQSVVATVIRNHFEKVPPKVGELAFADTADAQKRRRRAWSDSRHFAERGVAEKNIRRHAAFCGELAS